MQTLSTLAIAYNFYRIPILLILFFDWEIMQICENFTERCVLLVAKVDAHQYRAGLPRTGFLVLAVLWRPCRCSAA